MGFPGELDLIQVEAAKIYYAIFQKEIPLLIQNQFADISIDLHKDLSVDVIDRHYELIKKEIDLEAFEFAARIKHTYPLLTKKFQVMVYLAETMPENQSFFVNEKSNFLSGITQLIGGGFWSAWKLTKGLFIFWRNGSG